MANITDGDSEDKVRTVGQGVSVVALGVGKRFANTGDVFVRRGSEVDGSGYLKEKKKKEKKKKLRKNQENGKTRKTHGLTIEDRGNQIPGFGEKVDVVEIEEGGTVMLALLHKVVHVHVVDRHKGAVGHGAVGPEELVGSREALGSRVNVIHGLDHPEGGAEDQVVQVPVLEQPQPPLLRQQLEEDLPDFLD